MGIAECFSSTFKFRKTSLTVLLVLTYIAVILLQHFAYQNSLRLPAKEPVVLTEAWEHLQIISSTRHPFTSPKNDELHDYLKDVIETISDGIPYIEISSDKADNHTIMINQHDVFNKTNDDNRIIYYESSNLLVKIEGSDPKLPGVLLSAHFDSVPTSFGTTDDGMGIASMLAVLKHFQLSGKQPLRTIVFNFNNNEEFGLLGAEAFIQHKWFKDVNFFINLEGTGAGGQPILFRGTDKSVIDWYNYVSAPFANSIFQEGFKSGFISSQTDYHVYEKSGLRGLDIAFYIPRSFYHTFKDSIKFTSKGSLWMMCKNVLDILEVVTESKDTYDDDLGFSLYFDILNIWFFNFSVTKMFVWNVILLTLIPLITITLLILVSKRQTWMVNGRGWMRFPVAILLSYYAILFLTKYSYQMNPLIVSTNCMALGALLFSASMLTSYATLSISDKFTPIHDQKLHIFLEMSFISWLALIWMTFKQRSDSNIAGYCFTLTYLLTSVSTIIGLIGMIFKKLPCYDKTADNTSNYGSTDNAEDTQPDADSNPHTHVIMEDEPVNEAATESEPLLGFLSGPNEEPMESDYWHNVKHQTINSFQFDWLLQFVIFIPITVFFIYSEGKLIIDALAETVLQNNSYDEPVWELISAFSMLFALVIAPFSHKISFSGFIIILTVFVSSGFITYTSDYFTNEHPIKVRFVQNFNINHNSSTASVYGRSGFVKDIITSVPYISEQDLTIVNSTNRAEMISYEGFRPWLVDGTVSDNEYDKYMNITVESNSNFGVDLIDRFTPLESILKIEVFGSRQCYMTFNNSNPNFKAPVKMVTLYKDTKGYESEGSGVPTGVSRDAHGNWIFKTMKGIDLVELHKLAWTSGKSKVNAFRVKIQWLPFLYDNDVELIDSLGVNVQCHWSDYDDTVRVDGVEYSKVRNFVDVLQYTEEKVTWENLRPGIVQGNGYVEI